MSKAVKFDGGKLRYDLIPPEALGGLAGTYTLGAEKYGDRNWEKGLDYSRLYGALMRHLEEWRAGEDRDPEGQHHLDSVMWNAAALRTYEARGMGAKWDNLRARRKTNESASVRDGASGSGGRRRVGGVRRRGAGGRRVQRGQGRARGAR